jgi:hypothetical protein
MALAEIGLVVVDWIGMVHDSEKWRALVNVVINIQVL